MLKELTLHVARRAPFLVTRKGIDIAAGLLIFTLLTRAFSKEEYATYALVTGVFAIARVTSLPGLANAISQAYSRKHFGNFGHVLKLSVSSSFLGALMFVLVGLYYVYFSGNILLGYSLLIAGFCFVFFSPFQIWRQCAAGADEFSRLGFWDAIISIVRMASIVCCIWLLQGNYYLILATSILVPAFFHMVLSLAEFKRDRGNLETEPGTVPYGVRISFYDLPAIIAQQLDSLLIYNLLSPASMAIYVVAKRIPALLDIVAGEVVSTLSPIFANTENISKKMLTFFLFLSAAYLAICLLIAVFAIPILLPLLAGPQYGEAVFYAQIMTMGVALGLLGLIQFRFVKSRMHARIYLVLTALRSISGSLVVLVGIVGFGLLGVSVAFGLNGLVNSLITRVAINRYVEKHSDGT